MLRQWLDMRGVADTVFWEIKGGDLIGASADAGMKFEPESLNRTRVLASRIFRTAIRPPREASAL
jgi:hypothetical protein